MPRIATIFAWIDRHPYWVAIVFGLLAATGFQPLNLLPLALLGMAGFFRLVGNAPGWRKAFLVGWLFGLGHFTLANNWIATAFSYQAEMPAVLGWAAVPLLSLYLAVYPALAAAMAKRLGGNNRGWPFALILSACWIVTEWLRGWVFTGYAWDPFGIVFLGGFNRPGLAALAPWMGTYALSGLAVLLACAFCLMIKDRKWLPLALLSVLLVAAMAIPAGKGREGTLRFTLVQPDIRQEELNEPVFFEQSFRKTAALTLTEDPVQKRLVLWPESGVPDYLQDGYPERYYARTAYGDPALARARIGRVIGSGALMLTGTVDLEIEKGHAAGARNSVTAIDGAGDIRGSYDKAHLVPYGEYLPMRWLLEPLGLSRLVPGAIDFWAGPGARTLDLDGWGKAGVQICYEIVFSGHVVDRANRPDYIFNPSNDGWFGSFGPPQHLAQARLRAIEEGLPVLRATTTGISAVIDARGVVRQFAPMHVAKRIDGFVPPAHAPTLFSMLGNWLPLIWAVLLILCGLIALRRTAR